MLTACFEPFADCMHAVHHQSQSVQVSAATSEYLIMTCLQKAYVSMVLDTQALDLAREGNDNIKDEIWHELAQVQYMRWQQESAEQLLSQQQLQERMQQVLQLQHCQEAAAQVLNCVTCIESCATCCKLLQYYD